MSKHQPVFSLNARRLFALSCLMTALVVTTVAKTSAVQASSAAAPTCTAQTRATRYAATDDLAFIKASKIPLIALIEIHKIKVVDDFVLIPDFVAALTKVGIPADDAAKFTATTDARRLVNIVFLSPSHDVLDKSNGLLDTYGLAHKTLGQLVVVADNEFKLRASLAQLGLSPSQIEGFVKDAKPILLEARQSGLFQFRLTINLTGALADAGYTGETIYSMDKIGDAAQLKAYLTQNGVTTAKLPALLATIDTLRKSGLTADTINGWEATLVLNIVKNNGLPPLALSTLMAQGNNEQAISGCLTAFGLRADEVTLAMAQLYGFTYRDDGQAPLTDDKELVHYQKVEAVTILEDYGLKATDLADLFKDGGSSADLTAFLKSKGLSDEQIANFILDWQGSLVDETVAPDQVQAFEQDVQTEESSPDAAPDAQNNDQPDPGGDNPGSGDQSGSGSQSGSGDQSGTPVGDQPAN